MPLSSKERQERRRRRLKENGLYDAYKLRNAQYNAKYRQKCKELINRLPTSMKDEKLSTKREQQRLRQRKSRELRKLRVSSSTAISNIPFQSRRWLSRASNKVKKSLPNSPRKRQAVIKRLSSEVPQETEKHHRLTRLPEESVDKIKAFFYRDAISRMSPGSKDVICARDEDGLKVELQKRHLYNTVSETFSLFKEELFPEVKVGVSKFSELRPPSVLLSSETPSNMCLCVYHDNFITAIDALHSVLPTVPSYATNFPQTCVRNPSEKACWFGECDHDDCGFSAKYPLSTSEEVNSMDVRWKVWIQKNGRMVKEDQFGSVEDLHKHVTAMSSAFLKHVFIKRNQSKSFEDDKCEASQPDSRLAVLQIDFAENYKCVAQDEIQGAHWNQAQVCLFTSVMWRAENQVSSRVIVSDCLSHDKNSVIVFLDALLEAYGTENLDRLRIWSDGPASQFKNRYVAACLRFLSEKHQADIVWNYSVSGHGKGAVDGVGAALKRIATTKVRSRHSSINSADDFFRVVQNSTISTTFVSKEIIKECDELYSLQEIIGQAPPIKAIFSFHQIYLSDNGYVTKRFSSDNESHPFEKVEPNHRSTDNDIEQSDMAAVFIPGKHDNIRYICMSQVIQRDNCDVFVRFLKKAGNSYIWPFLLTKRGSQRRMLL